MEELRNIYSSFNLAKKLAKRGFGSSEFNVPPFTKEWYNNNGEIVTFPTELPRTNYLIIRSWLEHVGVLFATERIIEAPVFISRVFVRINGGTQNASGEELYRRYGRVRYYDDYETAEATTLEHAIMAVPI